MKLIAILLVLTISFFEDSSSHVISIHPYITRIPQAHHILQVSGPFFYEVVDPTDGSTEGKEEGKVEGNVGQPKENKPSVDDGVHKRKIDVLPPNSYIITGPDGVAIAAIRPFPGILPAFPVGVQYGVHLDQGFLPGGGVVVDADGIVVDAGGKDESKMVNQGMGPDGNIGVDSKEVGGGSEGKNENEESNVTETA